MNKQPFIIAQVLNMNGLELLKKSIPLLMAQNYDYLQVEVIDNGSTDESIKFLETNHPDINIIKNETNIGLAKARNQGFTRAIKKSADFVLTLDNDTFLHDSEIITKMINKITQMQRNNIFSIGVILKEGVGFLTENKKHILFPKQALKNRHFNSYRFIEETKTKLPDAEFTDFVCGCFMLVNIGVLKKIGRIDERYYIYYEETDLCFRAWQKGHPSIVLTGLEVSHQKAATNIIWSHFYAYYTIRNFLLFSKKHIKHSNNALFFHFLRIKKALGYAMLAVKSAIKQKNLIIVLKSVIFAFWDYAINRFGKRY